MGEVAEARVAELEASLSKLTTTVGRQSGWMEDVVGDLDSKMSKFTRAVRTFRCPCPQLRTAGTHA